MKLTQMRLRNYRQYKDVTLDFRITDDVSVIVGKTGSGKTNLLNAVTWCLYGDEAFSGPEEADTRTVKKTNKGMPLANIGPLAEQLAPGPLECSVELTFAEGDGRRAIVRREANFVVDMAGVPLKSGSTELRVLRQQGASGYDDVDDPEHWISRRLPKHIRPYYILNTERLNQFFHQGAEAKRVRQAILEIAKINTLDRMKTRLKAVRDDLFSAAGKSDKGGMLELLEKDRTDLVVEIDRLSDEIDNKSGQLESLERQMDALNDRMGDVEKASKVVVEFNSRRERLAQLEDQLEDLEQRMFASLVSAAPATLCADAVLALVDKVDEAWKAGRIPAPIHPDFLNELLHDESCICGRGLGSSQDQPARKCVQAMLERHQHTSELGALLQAQRGPAAVLVKTARSLTSDLEPLAHEMKGAEGERETITRRLEVLEQEMKALGVEDDLFGVLKGQWDAAVRQRDALMADIPRLDAKREQRQEELLKLQKNIEKEMKRRDDQQEHYRLLGFAEECVAAVNQAHTELITETREEVSQALNESFLDMIWKDQTFVGATIDEDYNVGVQMAKGYDAAAQLSGGEDVCLALSFSQALGTVSDFDVPLIFDSPLVKVDDEVKVLVAETMIRNLNGRQLILLMKPDEFAPEVERAIKEKSLASVVRLDFDEPSQSTTVVG